MRGYWVFFCALAISAWQTAAGQERPPWRQTKTALYMAFTGAIRHYDDSRTGLALARQASVESLAGRPAEAERLAERSYSVLRSA